MLLCDKYKPITKNDFLGFSETITEIEESLKSSSKSIILLYGESGCGKTSLVDYLLKSLNFKEICIDAQFVKSQKTFNEITSNVQYSYYVKTCIVFSDFENILNDNIYNNIIKHTVSKIPHNIIFTLHIDFYEKFKKCFSDISVNEYKLKNVKVDEMYKRLTEICKKENIKYTKKNLQPCLSHLPDIRKCIQNLEYVNNKDIAFTHNNDKLSSYLNNSNKCTNIPLFDMFTMIPLIHENYIKFCSLKKIVQMSDSIVFADIIQTHCYKHQMWDFSLYGMLYICGIFKQSILKKNYEASQFANGKILSRMSNKQTKYNTFEKLKHEYECNTTSQLYLCKRLGNPSKLLQNQFM